VVLLLVAAVQVFGLLEHQAQEMVELAVLAAVETAQRMRLLPMANSQACQQRKTRVLVVAVAQTALTAAQVLVDLLWFAI
jgi:hypothetical protein